MNTIQYVGTLVVVAGAMFALTLTGRKQDFVAAIVFMAGAVLWFWTATTTNWLWLSELLTVAAALSAVFGVYQTIRLVASFAKPRQGE